MKIRVTQYKSKIGATKSQKLILEALGIRKMNHSVIHEARPEILGMVKKLQHLVRYEEVND